jgi:hypothetical protein
MLMNSKTGIAFSIVAIAAVIALFASGPLVASAQAFPGGFGFHHNGFGFHHNGFGFHRFGFGFPGWGGGGWGGGCGGCCF